MNKILSKSILHLLKLIKKFRDIQMNSVLFTKNIIILYTEIKPILIVLKRYLQIMNMNVCYYGKFDFNLGRLSSFSLFLLDLDYIKYKKISNYNNNYCFLNSSNIGRFLINLLKFNGMYFNFHSCKFDVNLP
jgi:hypothetical protein